MDKEAEEVKEKERKSTKGKTRLKYHKKNQFLVHCLTAKFTIQTDLWFDTLKNNLSKFLLKIFNKHEEGRVHIQPEVISSLLLAESTSWDHTYPGFLQQFEAVQHVRSQRQGLHVHRNRKDCDLFSFFPSGPSLQTPSGCWDRLSGF